MIFKNKKLFLKIYIPFVIITIIALIVLQILSSKKRVGYLTDFNLEIYRTLELNNLNDIREDFTVDGKLDEENIKNYLLTNENITNYVHHFRIRYYDKVFRNNDIYGVYPDLSNLPDYMKNSEMDGDGSPYGNFISDKKEIEEKIDNINYILKVKSSLKLAVKFIIGILIIILILPITNKILNSLLLKLFPFFKNIIYKLNNKIYIDNYKDCNLCKNSKPNNYIFILTFIIFFPFIYLIYQSIYSSFPYYISWDSTHIYAMDILLSSSNIMPDHFFHPNIFPLILYKYIFVPIGKLLNIISINNINELKNSSNPYLAYSEFAEYILSVCKISFMLFCAFMYINIIKIIRIHIYNFNKIYLFINSLLFLLISFIWANSIFINTVIRYETIGLLLCSISLYFTITASNISDKYSVNHTLCILASGFFAGAAFLSKILFAGYIISIPLIYITLNNNEYKEYDKVNNKLVRISFNILLITTIILIVFYFIFYYFVITEKIIPTAFLNLSHKGSLLILGFILPLSFIILTVLIFLILRNKIIINNKIKVIIYPFTLYIISCIFPILFALLLPNGMHVLFNTYIFSYGLGHFDALFSMSYAASNKHLYAIIIIIVSIYLIFNIVKTIKLSNIQNINRILLQIIISVILVLFAFFIKKFLRAAEKDIIIANSLLIISLFILYRNILYTNLKKYFSIIFIVISLIYISNQLLSLINFNKSIIKSAYVFTKSEWKDFSYGFRENIYVNIMTNAYKTEKSWDTAFYWTRNIKQVRKLLSQISMKNNSLKDTAISEKGMYVSTNKLITNIDKNLTGGLLIALNDKVNEVYLRADYDFYLLTSKEYSKKDSRMIIKDYQFYINDNPYFVYKLSMDSWLKLNYGYNGDYKFSNEEIEDAFILIVDKLAKEL